LKKCKILEIEGPAAVDLDIMYVDDIDMEEMKEAQHLAQDPMIRRAIEDASTGFKETMIKIRETSKVHSCNTQIESIKIN